MKGLPLLLALGKAVFREFNSWKGFIQGTLTNLLHSTQMLAFYTSIVKDHECGSILLITNLVCNIPGHVFFFCPLHWTVRKLLCWETFFDIYLTGVTRSRQAKTFILKYSTGNLRTLCFYYFLGGACQAGQLLSWLNQHTFKTGVELAVLIILIEREWSL